MRSAALAALWPWLGQFEGLWLDDGTMFQWLGLDTEGRTVTALGADLASPRAMAAIIWRHGTAPDAPQATYDEICHEWARVQAMQSHKGEGAASKVFRESAHLYLDVASLYDWCARKLAAMEEWVRSHSPIGEAWDGLPSVVQIARARTLWAEGDVVWPKLDAAIVAGDWAACVDECVPGDMETQPESYRASYRAVEDLYRQVGYYPGDALPDAMPDGR